MTTAVAYGLLIAAVLFFLLVIYLAVCLQDASAALLSDAENIAALESELADTHETARERLLTIAANERCIISLKQTLLKATDITITRRIEATHLRKERDDAHRVLEFVLNHEDVAGTLDVAHVLRRDKDEILAALGKRDNSSVPRMSPDKYQADFKLRSVE